MRYLTQTHKLSLKLLTAIAVLALGATVALADSLAVIPTLAGDTDNEARAITPDGQYIVGLSGSRGFLYPVGAGSATFVLSSDNAAAAIANGVGYRTSGGGTELVIAGFATSGHVAEWMTTDGGTTFAVKRRDTSYSFNQQPFANSLGAQLGTDVYYVTSSKAAGGQPVYLNQLSGPWAPAITYTSKGIPGGVVANMNGVSASGRAVGYRQLTAGGTRGNYMMQFLGAATTPSSVFFPGLDGSNAGEAHSVSADGNTIFGRSPTPSSSDLYGYKATFSGNTQLTIDQLPNFGDEAGSTSLQVPYGASADGGFAVGMDYRGTEKAVFWDTRDANPLNWTITDLTQLASDSGILDGFTRLKRAYSIGLEDGTMSPVITGVGDWTDGVNSYSRAWVMVIPEPTAGALLGVGLLGLLALRRRK